MFALALAAAISFPEPSPETRPWGICHLLGSAAETGELSREMRRWSEGGLGGVRVVPIYGANGYEHNLRAVGLDYMLTMHQGLY